MGCNATNDGFVVSAARPSGVISAGVGVKAVGVDAFALAAFFGVGADVEKIFAVRFRRCGGGQERGEEKCRQQSE